MNTVSTHGFKNFDESFEALKEASPLMKPAKVTSLLSQVDILARSRKGIEYLYDRALDLERAGIFAHSAWSNPKKQVPTLVKGTLLAGHPSSSLEILSELRILAYANGRSGDAALDVEEARNFLEEVVVHNFEFAFDELTEESRVRLSPQERRKIVQYFQFLISKADLHGVKSKLVEEIKMVCAQRPLVTDTVRNLIETVYQKLDLAEDRPVDQDLQYFVNAVYFPGPLAARHTAFNQYKKHLKELSEEELRTEASRVGSYLHQTGLTNPYLAILLRHILKVSPELISSLLHLNSSGQTEFERFQDFLQDFIPVVFNEQNYRGIYGLKRMLERNLFSRREVRSGLVNLKLINIHPHVTKRIEKAMSDRQSEVSAKQYLIAATVGILGQPLGIGQGNNATCQSARGISMWAQHAPAKLINMITTVATADNLIMRFEHQDLESIKLGKGLVQKLDYQLDAVSILLVPHLDKIYNEMMRLSSGRGEDPHKWTNPALYGYWVPTGFASAYSYLTHSIHDFEGFIRLLYASFHPLYNEQRKIVYPNPVGIFITSSKGDMLGFHAVSLLRVAKAPDGITYRAYFLNPNNEGRQDWGQGIQPTVYGNGERFGESSLPLFQFAARIYAFHYNPLGVNHLLDLVPKEAIQEVKVLAEASWGNAYTWNDNVKKW
jgi:hypothetical protein